MTLWSRLRSWLRATLQPSRTESEMDAELRAHLEYHTEQLILTGLSAEEAHRRAKLDFGVIGLVKEDWRDSRHATLLPSLLQDIGFGLRMFRKSPGFAVLAVITLALGIGATTAVFSLVNGVLLRALPYRNPEQLVYLWEPVPRIPGVPLEGWGPFNADFYDWQQQSHSFANLALFSTDRKNLSVGGVAVRVNSSSVTGEFFQTLGVAPELGRAVGPSDDQPGRGQVAVISHALWQSRFGSDRGVLGKGLLLNAKSYRIIGVMPAGFGFPHGTESLDTLNTVTDIWLPWAMTPKERAQRDNNPGTAIGRLRLGVPLARTQAEIGAITARVDSLHPAKLQGSTTVIRPFDVSIVGTSRRALLIFMAAVMLVLLIACSNVASLILARAYGRAREFGLRTALGASRLRLICQLSVESLCLAGAGGSLGVLAAFFIIRLLIHTHPANIPRLEETSLDGRVVLFAVCTSLATVVLCGLFPALSASRCDLNQVLKSSSSRTARGTMSSLHRGLTIAQVAFTFVLLTGSGLLIRSFLNLRSVDKGFRPSSTVTMNIQLDGRYNQPERQNAFFRGLLATAAQLPGVEASGAVTHLPLGGGQSISFIEVQGHLFDNKTFFEDRSITPRYFAAMGIPLIEGRDFTDDDVAGRQPAIIVSRSFARKYFPGQSALGKQVHTTGHRIIVGVVGDVRQSSLENGPPMQFYLPLWQTGVYYSAYVVVRTTLPTDRLASSMRTLVRNLDANVAVADFHTMSDVVSGATAERRFQTFLLTAFGGMGLFLSLVGLYALMTYSVQRRTAEIGIRMALGAQPRSVMSLVLRQGSALALAGIALGFACSCFVNRSIASLLFEVRPTDAGTFFAVAFLFCAVALAACYVPARRATRVDPLISLRTE